MIASDCYYSIYLCLGTRARKGPAQCRAPRAAPGAWPTRRISAPRPLDSDPGIKIEPGRQPEPEQTVTLGGLVGPRDILPAGSLPAVLMGIVRVAKRRGFNVTSGLPKPGASGSGNLQPPAASGNLKLSWRFRPNRAGSHGARSARPGRDESDTRPAKPGT